MGHKPSWSVFFGERICPSKGRGPTAMEKPVSFLTVKKKLQNSPEKATKSEKRKKKTKNKKKKTTRKERTKKLLDTASRLGAAQWM